MLASEEKLFSDALDGDEVSTCLLTSGSTRLLSSDELSAVLGDSAFLGIGSGILAADEVTSALREAANGSCARERVISALLGELGSGILL